MADIRTCDQCGGLFRPRREHARFCSARCRIAWNSAHHAGPAAEVSALQWSVTAMNDTAGRLPAAPAGDPAKAFAVIAEVVWQVTIVDATLVRYYPDAYDAALAARSRAGRTQTEGTLGGLRFVRNRMRHEADRADFIRPLDDPHAEAGGPVAGWTWRPVPAPPLESLRPRGREWALTRYAAYSTFLAGRPVGESLGRAADFLRVAAAGVAAVSQQASRPG